MEHTTPDLIPYRKGDKWGFCTPDKKIVIECIYDETGDSSLGNNFIDGFIRVKLHNKYGVIDKNGQEIVPCIYEDLSCYSEGLTQVRQNNKFGYIDKNGVLLIPCIFDDACSFSGNLAAVYINGKHGNFDGKWGYIDRNGTVVIPFEFLKAGFFINNLAPCHFGRNLSELNDSCWGYINKHGEKIISDSYKKANSFKEGLATVCNSNNMWGYIDEEGKTVIEFKFKNAWSFSNAEALVSDGQDEYYIDKKGKMIGTYIGENRFLPKYKSNVYCSMWKSKKNDKWGFSGINHISAKKFEHLEIPCIYDYVWNFSNGLALVKLNGKFGYIDKNGTQFWED